MSIDQHFLAFSPCNGYVKCSTPRGAMVAFRKQFKKHPVAILRVLCSLDKEYDMRLWVPAVQPWTVVWGDINQEVFDPSRFDSLWLPTYSIDLTDLWTTTKRRNMSYRWLGITELWMGAAYD